MAQELWEDRDVRFHITHLEMEMRPGEKIIDKQDSIENSRNDNTAGFLIVTNLRLIWHPPLKMKSRPQIKLFGKWCPSKKSVKYACSIGYKCITETSANTVDSEVCDTGEKLTIKARLCKYNGSRFEFIFTNLVPWSNTFASVLAVHSAFKNTMTYRDLLIRKEVLKNKQLLMLPQELLYNEVSKVINLTSDQCHLGTMFITNIRIVWYSHQDELFNMSLPYVQTKSIKTTESENHGLCLALETTERSGAYRLGFRIEPFERLQSVVEEMQSMWRAHNACPEFGVQIETNKEPLEEPPEPTAPLPDDAKLGIEFEDNTKPQEPLHSAGQFGVQIEIHQKPLEESLEPTAPLQEDPELGIEFQDDKKPQEPLEPSAPVQDDVIAETNDGLEEPVQERVYFAGVEKQIDENFVDGPKQMDEYFTDGAKQIDEVAVDPEDLGAAAAKPKDKLTFTSIWGID